MADRASRRPPPPPGEPYPAAATPLVLAQIFQHAPDGIIVVDAAGVIVLANGQAEAMFGAEPGGLAGSPVDALVPHEARAVHAEHRGRYGADPHLRPMANDLDLHARHRSGALFPVEISLSPVHPEAAGPGRTIAVIRDVTERRRAEQRRRELIGEVHAQLERQRIAADLHDDMVQSLYAAGLSLYAAREDPAIDSAAAITRALNELNAAIADLRAYIHYLRGDAAAVPGALLRSRLEELLRSYRGDTAWTVDFDLPSAPHERDEQDERDELDEELQRHLFLLLKEMISNVERHAEARTATVRVRNSAGALELEVADDGRGFDPGDLPADAFGLRGMTDRVSGLGGTLRVESSAAGSTVRVHIPHPTGDDPADLAGAPGTEEAPGTGEAASTAGPAISERTDG